jgi:Zn finger protein HypA/HybF involved in hydrogenase expression
MVKKYLVFNHEAWKKCSKCGSHFDFRNHGYECPYCKINKK